MEHHSNNAESRCATSIVRVLLQKATLGKLTKGQSRTDFNFAL